MYDVPREHYASAIRELIRHENDVTNHRIMWLLIGQGFIANAYVSAVREVTSTDLVLPLVGIPVALSAFVMLYKSYRARGYLLFLGEKARRGTLQEEHLPLTGWPRKRIKGWWREVWVCRWIAQAGDVLEPWLFLPYLFLFMWLTALLRRQTTVDAGVGLILVAVVAAVFFSVFCILSVWWQGKDDDLIEKPVTK